MLLFVVYVGEWNEPNICRLILMADLSKEHDDSNVHITLIPVNITVQLTACGSVICPL